MSELVFLHECIILDADCTISLAASGMLSSILECIPCARAVSRHVYDAEVLRFDLQPCIDQGILQVAVPQGVEYDTIVRINIEVNMPFKVLGDGEIETVAIATHRNWAIGMDDKRAREYSAKHYPPGQLLTTPELLRHWVDTAHPSADDIRATLEKVQIVGRYTIGQKHPLYSWWQSLL
jgi:hypothetical protein